MAKKYSLEYLANSNTVVKFVDTRKLKEFNSNMYKYTGINITDNIKVALYIKLIAVTKRYSGNDAGLFGSDEVDWSYSVIKDKLVESKYKVISPEMVSF